MVMMLLFRMVIVILAVSMTVCFETARMFAGDARELPIDRLYGVMSFELG